MICDKDLAPSVQAAGRSLALPLSEIGRRQSVGGERIV